MADYLLRHDITLCPSGVICPFVDKIYAWDGYDYSDPKTKCIEQLTPGTPIKIVEEKFPGVLIELEDGKQYWVCKWDVDKADR